MEQDGELPVYSVIDAKQYLIKQFTQLLVDLPIEFRWRTSTYESYKFGGFMGVKFSYSLYNKSQFSDDLVL
jgi:hypothetical protein